MVSEKEGEVKGLAGRVETVQGLASQLRRQITLAEERLPQLEEAKKTAVAGINNTLIAVLLQSIML